MSRNLIVISILFALLYPTASFADPPALEITPDGNVAVGSELSVNQEITVPKANITSVLHLTPLSSPPANPSAGDIYFTTTDELLIYANGKWTPIVSASASHGTKLFTSGSGTWTVPAGIYSLTVTLAGGGGGGGGGNFISAPRDEPDRCLPGGNGGNGGVQLGVYMDVAPGQKISYSIGAGGSAGMTNYSEWYSISTDGGKGRKTFFGNLSASGGQGGSRTANGSGGSPSGTYPYGANGQGGAGSTSCKGVPAGAGASGAISIQY